MTPSIDQSLYRSIDQIGDWADLPFFETDFPSLADALSQEPRPILPPASQVFAALELCPPDRARVVILGQDPYPTPGHAHGLAFSVQPEVSPLPKSLKNIFQELAEDQGAAPPNGDLRFWARQGVLLLNTALTVPAGQANGHAKLGWQPLTHQILARLSDRPRAFVLWGKPAQKLAADIGPPHFKVESPHPSPLSAYRGFFGSRPFSQVNDWLEAQGDAPINWTEPDAT